jgi:hypothetical protein
MSMVYDPVTREFRPRESRAEKPKPVDLALLSSEPLRPAGPEFEPRRPRRRFRIHLHRRHRELLAFCLYVLMFGVLIWTTVWVWGQWRHSSPPKPEQPPIIFRNISND